MSALSTRTPELRIVRTLWLILVAAVVGLFPFTIYSTFLVPIADSAEASPAAVGALRGLGAVSALLVGVAFAPLLDRFARHHVCTGALGLLAAGCVVGAQGGLAAQVAFCAAIGCATAILTPALLVSATERFDDEATSARAATMVTAVQSLAAVLAGPVIGLLAAWRGWQFAMLFTAAVAMMVAVGFHRCEPPGRGGGDHIKYLSAFVAVARRPRLLGLVAIAILRTAAFMGYLAYLAALYHDRFGMTAGVFTVIWTISGAAFFSGNYLAGRFAYRGGNTRPVWLMAMGLATASVAVLTVFTTDSMPIAVAATALQGFAHAWVAAGVTTGIVRAAGPLKTITLSVTAAGMSLGVFIGAALGGIGLAAGGYRGAAAMLAGLTVLALALAVAMARGGVRAVNA